ncbi:MAG: hypothetical protein JNL10_01465, partial [Verrucomicrobiales bacterium]|nr:hypothetical protein [Verrucomicrobiales bacterium]
LNGTGVDSTPPTASIRVSAVEVCWNSVPGLRYQPEVSSSADGPWSPLGSPIPATLAATCITDTVEEAPKYYRIVPILP